jgi:hypothetical protein
VVSGLQVSGCTRQATIARWKYRGNQLVKPLKSMVSKNQQPYGTVFPNAVRSRIQAITADAGASILERKGGFLGVSSVSKGPCGLSSRAPFRNTPLTLGDWLATVRPEAPDNTQSGRCMLTTVGGQAGRTGIVDSSDHPGNPGGNVRHHSVPRQLLHEPLSRPRLYRIQRSHPGS